MNHPGCSCSALRMAARRLTQIYDGALAPEGLTVSQYALLNRLAVAPQRSAPTVRDLAEALALDRTTLGHNLRPLERDGLVRVETDPHDRRIRRIHLTPAGDERRQRCQPLWQAAQSRFDAAFGVERARSLHDDLLAIVRTADATLLSSTGPSRHAG